MNNSRDKLHNTSLQLISINHLHNFHGSMNKYAAIIFLFLVIFQGLVNCIFLIYVFPPRKTLIQPQPIFLCDKTFGTLPSLFQANVPVLLSHFFHFKKTIYQLFLRHTYFTINFASLLLLKSLCSCFLHKQYSSFKPQIKSFHSTNAFLTTVVSYFL